MTGTQNAPCDIFAGLQPEDMTVDTSGAVFVSNHGNSNVSIISETGVLASVLLGGGLEEIPGGMASQARLAYIAVVIADGSLSAMFTIDTAIGYPPLAVNFSAVTSGTIDK